MTTENNSDLPPHFKVGLMVLNASDWSRRVHEGIAAYAREVQNWYCWLQPRGLTEMYELPGSWEGDGIIGRLADARRTEAVLELGIPAVNISWHGEHTVQIPKVMSDQQACGRISAEYYLERGFAHVGYVGPQSFLHYEDGILPAVQKTCSAAEVDVHCFHPDNSQTSPDLEAQRPNLDAWILSLPKPIGIVAWSTIVAREIAISCQNLGLSVPDDVALLAVEHDPLLSSLSPVPISYVRQRPQIVGYEAAHLLDRMMHGEPAPEEPVLIAPEGIAETVSTGTRFARDELVSQAIQFIEDNVHEPLQVADLTRAMHVSRRSLEDRFRKVLNRSPAEEIRSKRVCELKRMLRETDQPLGEIAFACGFSYQEVMIRFFKKSTGQTPSEYRRSERDCAYREPVVNWQP